MKESIIEKMLRIETSKSETRMDRIKHYNRYEPTPYSALEKLFRHYEINDKDFFVDFGSGKGRFSFFVNYFFNSGCTSVEIVEEFHKKALKNYDSYIKRNPKAVGRLFYVNNYAEKYEISKFENKFYFFNPFSVNIFIGIVNKIIKSVELNNREVDIILYYPSMDYIAFLDRKTAFQHVMDISLDESDRDPREKFAIYRFGERNNRLEDECVINIDIKTIIYQENIICKNKK